MQICGPLEKYWPGSSSAKCASTGPYLLLTRSAYSLLHDASRLLTWSAADICSLTVTPRMQMLLTRSMPGHGAGRLADFPRLPRPVMTISFVFPLFNFKLFWAAQTPICSISWLRVLDGTWRNIAETVHLLKILCIALTLLTSVRRRRKNIDLSSNSNPLCRRQTKKLCRVDAKTAMSSSTENVKSVRTFSKNSPDLLTGCSSNAHWNSGG